MRSLVSITAALAASALVAACGGGGDTADAPNDPARGSYTVTLRTGQAVTVPQESLSLLLTRVDDSRCPINALCVWMGQAVVAVQVQQSGQAAETLTIGMPVPSDTKLPGDGSYRGWRISLQGLDPAPVAGVVVPQDQYRATVRIDKAQ
jgi:hypothetical protein